MISLAIWIALNMVNAQNENCIFRDKTSQTSATLDLRPISGQKIASVEIGDYWQFNYTFTACSNDLICEYNTTTNYNAMMLQINPLDTVNRTKPFCTVIADWDNGEIQPEYRYDSESWYFLYSNGLKKGCVHTDNTTYPRHLALEILCGNHLRNDEFVVIDMGEMSEKCFYQVILQSGAACIGSASTNDNLSGGSIVVILFLVAMFLYCSVGCIFTKCSKFPHQHFWEKFPAYVFAGFQVTRSFFCGTCGC
eukprot:140480_1